MDLGFGMGEMKHPDRIGELGLRLPGARVALECAGMGWVEGPTRVQEGEGVFKGMEKCGGCISEESKIGEG